MTPSGGASYTCANCGETFETDWTAAEAEAEAQALWGEQLELQGRATICDDCFREFIAWARERGYLP